jgi:hypothetical protein
MHRPELHGTQISMAEWVLGLRVENEDRGRQQCETASEVFLSISKQPDGRRCLGWQGGGIRETGLITTWLPD